MKISVTREPMTELFYHSSTRETKSSLTLVLRFHLYSLFRNRLYGIVKSYLGTHDSYRSDALMDDNNIYITFIFMINNFELIFLIIYFIYTL